MMFQKSRLSEIWGTVVDVKAIMSRGRPGTAAEMSFEGPRDERSSERRRGNAEISHTFSELGCVL